MCKRKLKLERLKLIVVLPSVCLKNFLKSKRKITKDNQQLVLKPNLIVNCNYNEETESIDLESYYDAYDSFEDGNVTNQETLSSDVTSSSSDQINNYEKLDFNSKSSIEFEDEEELDDEQLDLSKEKSVITYILSNIKIGMDLESINLPAFILDSRSLLEMYADFYSFSNYFIQITDGESEYERFRRVIKWYLTTFRARLVPKKPYNPVLGEVFIHYRKK